MNKIIKRSRQFFRAVFSEMDETDHEFAVQYLDETQKLLFYNMDVPIQKHCVNVARTALEMIHDRPGLDRRLLIQAALLHDIGKTGGSFTVLDRVWYVLVKKVSRPLALKLARKGRGNGLARLRNSFYVHINHESIGSSMAEKAGLGSEVIYMIRNHHNRELASPTDELAVLILADELN